MENSFSKILAVLIAIVLLFIYPTYQQAQRQDNLTQIVVDNTTRSFVDAVRTKGFITPRMFLDFNQKLGATGNQYEITLEHLHKKYNPVYSDPSDPNTFMNSFGTLYDGHYTDEIMEYLFPDNIEPENSELRKYKLSVNDYFTVKVKNTNRTMATVLRDFLTAGNTGSNTAVFTPYGGMILNEDY